MIRFNKTTSLLICGTMVSSMLPLTIANASVVELETKEGFIDNAQAFANGMYIYDGYKTDDSEEGTYFSTPKGDILIEDATGVGEKYGMNYINFKDDDILFNMMTGKAEEDSEYSKVATLKSKFRHKVLNKVDRYKNVDDETFEIKGKLAKDCFSSVWYEADVKDNDNNRVYDIYINENGDYIDVSEDLDIVYYDADGNKIKIDTYKDLENYNKKNNGALSILMSKTLMPDSSNIYRAFVLLDSSRGNIREMSIEDAINNGVMNVYVQKISMEQGDKKDEAYLPKEVETYEANDLRPILMQVMNSGEDISESKDISARILGKNIYIVKPDSDEGKISFEGYKMTTIKDEVNGKTIRKKAVEKDDDFDGIRNEDMDDYSIDAYANLWVLSKGKIKKYENGELKTYYKVDRSMNKISVFDDNSMIVWNTDNEIYSVVSPLTTSVDNTSNTSAKTATASETNNAPVEAKLVQQTGWIKNEDGSWSFKNLDGTTASGWINDNGNWYYLNNNGIMQTGWIKDGSDWYYLNPSGEMKTGWHKDNNGNWYYLLDSGKMAYNTVINGYVIDSNGVWV